MLKQGLELKQTQKLSPLQIQTIKLIELPIQELEQRIRKEMEENPVLDEDQPKEKEEDEAPREVSLSEYKEDDAIPSYRLRSDNYSKDERPQYNTFSVKESFTQSLQEQLGYRNLVSASSLWHHSSSEALMMTATFAGALTESLMTFHLGRMSRLTSRKCLTCLR